MASQALPQLVQRTARPFAAVLMAAAALLALGTNPAAQAQAAPQPAEVAVETAALAQKAAAPATDAAPQAKQAAASAKPQTLVSAPANAAALDKNGLPVRPQGPVLDAANILDPASEAALDARLRAYNAQTGRALIVATVPSLNGDTIESYAVRLFETWGIGGADTDQGLLLLVAPNERQVRIEVGYGLHQYVTDILSGRIIRGDITPAFQAGDFAGGINAGVNALITQLDRDPADARAIAEAAAAAEKANPNQEGATIGGVIFWIVMIVFFVSLFARGGGGKRKRYGAGSSIGQIVLWHAIGSALGSGRGGHGGFGGGGGGFGGGGGGFGGFGGGMSGGGGASGSW